MDTEQRKSLESKSVCIAFDTIHLIMNGNASHIVTGEDDVGVSCGFPNIKQTADNQKNLSGQNLKPIGYPGAQQRR